MAGPVVKVSTPVKDYTGVVAGAEFVNGTGEVETGTAAHTYFLAAGYTVDEPTATAAVRRTRK